MILKEVGGDKGLKRMFLEFPVSLYASDPNWIRPLDQDIEVIFDPNKNIHFKKGEAIRWILFDENQRPIGRVAAFYENKEINLDESLNISLIICRLLPYKQ